MDNNNDKTITFDDIEFRPSKAYPSSRHADLFLDNGLCANIFEDHKDGEDNIRYVISLSKDDEYIDFSLPSICERTNNIDAKSKDELIKILNIASQITEDDIFDPLDDYVVENNNKAITFDDIEFNKNSRLGKRGIVHFSNGIRASIIKLNEQFSQKFGAEYKISLLNEHGVPLDTDLCSREQTLNAKDTQELNELLKKSQKLDENGKLQPEVLKDNASEQMEDYDTERYQEEDDDYDRDDDDDMDNNSEKKAITFDDLEFEPYDEYPSFSKRAFLTLDNYLSASVLEFSAEGQESFGYKYGIILRDYENAPLDLSNKGICGIAGATTDQKLIKMLNLASKFPNDIDNPWFNGYISKPYEEYIDLIDERDYSKNKPNETKEFITWDDLKFEPYGVYERCPSNWAHTSVKFDLGSLHIIRISNEDGSIKHYDCMKYTADCRQCCDAFGVYNTDKEYLNNFLRECQCEFGLNQNDELPKEKTETLKSAEKEDRAKQSAERIRVKKKSVSGVYVADKIGEAMRSGVVSETVTPEKGKQLSDNIKKKYIMDRQQKS